MMTMSISEGQQRLFELRERVVADHDQVILTHKSGNVVLISIAEWEAYEETCRLLKDTATLQALLQSFEMHDAGLRNGKSPVEVFADLA